MLDSLVLLIAFPAIQRSFASVSSAELSWVLNAYTIVYGTLLVPAGSLADRLGRRRMFLLGAGLFTLASLLCAFAPSVDWLIGLRARRWPGGWRPGSASVPRSSQAGCSTPPGPCCCSSARDRRRSTWSAGCRRSCSPAWAWR